MRWVMVIHNEIDTLNMSLQDSMSLAEPPTDSEIRVFVIKPDISRVRAFSRFAKIRICPYFEGKNKVLQNPSDHPHPPPLMNFVT